MRICLSLAGSALVALFASSCSAPAVGCDFRSGDDGDETRCQERSGFSVAAFSALCETTNGVVVEGGCPTEGIVAGCDMGTQGDGTAVIDWYYAPETVETVQARCDDEDAELITP